MLTDVLTYHFNGFKCCAFSRLSLSPHLSFCLSVFMYGRCPSVSEGI